MHVGLPQGRTVDPHLLVDHAQSVPGHANHTLDEVLLRIHRVMEDNDIAARNLLVRHRAICGAAPAIAKFIHQQVVADQQRVFHGLRWNLERLNDERNHEDRDDYRAHQRLHRPHQVRGRGSMPSNLWGIHQGY